MVPSVQEVVTLVKLFLNRVLTPTGQLSRLEDSITYLPDTGLGRIVTNLKRKQPYDTKKQT